MPPCQAETSNIPRPFLLIALSVGWIFLPLNLLGGNSPERWDEALSKFKTAGGCRWEFDAPVDCTVQPREFELVVKDVLQAGDLRIPVLSDSEFDNKGLLRVLSGIRCAPLHYPLRIEGGFVGVGGQQVYEVTQFYVQLTEPKPGVTQFRVLRRSAQHFSRNLELRSLDQPPNAKRIALIIKDRVAVALSSAPNIR